MTQLDVPKDGQCKDLRKPQSQGMIQLDVPKDGYPEDGDELLQNLDLAPREGPRRGGQI
jgi:hypothetical protein